ncbi:hypothetical protein V8G54_015004, partial [Vigna mungo]
ICIIELYEILVPSQSSQNFYLPSHIFNSNCSGHLGFWNDFNGHLLSLHLSFLHLSNTSVSKMPSPNLISNFIFISEMFGESKSLVQPSQPLSLRYGDLVGFHRPVPPRQRRPYVLRWGGRQKRSLEEAARRDG